MIIKHHGSLKKDIKKMLLNTPNLRGFKNNSTILITEIMFHTRIISSIIPKCVYHQKKGDIGKIIASQIFRNVKNPNIQIVENMYFSIKNKIIIILILVLLSILILNLKKAPLKKNIIIMRGMKRLFNPIGMNAINKKLFSPSGINAINTKLPNPTLYYTNKNYQLPITKSNIITIDASEYSVINTNFEENFLIANTEIIALLLEQPLKDILKNLHPTILKYQHTISPLLLKKISELKTWQQVQFFDGSLKKGLLFGGFGNEKLTFFIPHIIKFFIGIKFRWFTENEITQYAYQFTQHGFNNKNEIFGQLHSMLLRIKACDICTNPYGWCFPCLTPDEGLRITMLASLNHGLQPEFFDPLTQICRLKPKKINESDFTGNNKPQYASEFSPGMDVDQSVLSDIFFDYGYNDLLNYDYLYTLYENKNTEDLAALIAKRAMDEAEKVVDDIHA